MKPLKLFLISNKNHQIITINNLDNRLFNNTNLGKLKKKKIKKKVK